MLNVVSQTWQFEFEFVYLLTHYGYKYKYTYNTFLKSQVQLPDYFYFILNFVSILFFKSIWMQEKKLVSFEMLDAWPFRYIKSDIT